MFGGTKEWRQVGERERKGAREARRDDGYGYGYGYSDYYWKSRPMKVQTHWRKGERSTHATTKKPTAEVGVIVVENRQQLGAVVVVVGT